MPRFSLLLLWERLARKRMTHREHTERDPPEASPPNRARQITKHRYLQRRRMFRFLRLLRLHPIPRPRLNRCFLSRVREPAPVLIPLKLPRHRPLPKRPPHRRLEIVICGNILLRAKWLPRLSHRASETLLSEGCSHHRGANFCKPHARSSRRSISHRYCDQAVTTGWDVSDYERG